MPVVETPNVPVATPSAEAKPEAVANPTPAPTATPAPKAAANPVKKVAKSAPPKATAKAAAPKATPVKKVATPSAPKSAPAKKAETAAKAATEGGKAKKDGLRKPQIRVLQALAKKDGLTRAQIAERGNVDLAMLNSYIGAHNEEVRAANDAANFPCLLTLKMVRDEVHDVDGKDVVHYSLTALGRKAVEKLS